MASDTNYMSNSYKKRIEEFQIAISNVTRMLQTSIYTPFVEFRCGDLYLSTHANTDYFMQLDFTFTGAGEANSAKLNLVYVPKPGQSPNLIDIQLNGVTARNDTCTLKFGYGGDYGSYNMRTHTYECIVLGYSCSLRENMIFYTIELVSSLTRFRENRYNFPVNREKWELNADGKYTTEMNPIDEVRLAFETYCPGYKVYTEDRCWSCAHWTNLEPMDDVTVFQYADTLLANIEDNEDPEALYWYEICDAPDDKKGWKSIYIHRSTQDNSSINTVASSSYNEIIFTFDWGGNHTDANKNGLIVGFETEFNGAVNIAVDAVTNGSNILKDRYVIDSSGNLVSICSPEDINVGDYAVKDATSITKFWSYASSWAYNAQLEIIGIPADIPIGVVIEVNPIIYGQKHHTAGKYMITGARSTITSAGFITSLSLFKVPVTESNKLKIAKDMILARASEQHEAAQRGYEDAQKQALEDQHRKEQEKAQEITDSIYVPEKDSVNYIPDYSQAQKAKAEYEATSGYIPRNESSSSNSSTNSGLYNGGK